MAPSICIWLGLKWRLRFASDLAWNGAFHLHRIWRVLAPSICIWFWLASAPSICIWFGLHRRLRFASDLACIGAFDLHLTWLASAPSICIWLGLLWPGSIGWKHAVTLEQLAESMLWPWSFGRKHAVILSNWLKTCCDLWAIGWLATAAAIAAAAIAAAIVAAAFAEAAFAAAAFAATIATAFGHFADYLQTFFQFLSRYSADIRSEYLQACYSLLFQILCRLFADILQTSCRFWSGSMEAVYKQSDGILQNFWQTYFQEFLRTACMHSAGSLQSFWKHFADYLQTICTQFRHFTGW